MANLLGALGVQPIADAPQQLPGVPDINASLAANALKPHPESKGLFHQGGTVRNILGAIGDAFLVQSGHEPVYAKRMQQQRLASALGNYLGNLDPGMAEIFEQSPEVGMSLYKLKHPTNETPAALKEYEYYKGLQGPDRGSFEQYLKLTHPGMMSPITLGPGDTYDPGTGGASLPHVTDQASYDAVPAGGQYTTPDGNIRTKGGATASTPSPTFPGR
jgi:hypothetical protein